MHVLLLTSLAALAQLQGPGVPAPAPQAQAQSEDHAAIHREMIELFKAIDLRQRAIDRLLYDAGAGHVPAEQSVAAGIGASLAKAKDGSQQVTRDIDRSLELAASHTHQSGGT
jgi:hypothetical protein